MKLSPRIQLVLAYLFWIVTCLLTVFVLLQLSSAFSVLLAGIGWHQFTQRASVQFFIILVGLVSLGFMIYVEQFYRTGSQKEQSFPRFFRMTFYQIVILLLAHLLLLVGQFMLGLSLNAALSIVGIDLIACLLFYWLWHRTTVADEAVEDL